MKQQVGGGAGGTDISLVSPKEAMLESVSVGKKDSPPAAVAGVVIRCTRIWLLSCCALLQKLWKGDGKLKDELHLGVRTSSH